MIMILSLVAVLILIAALFYLDHRQNKKHSA